MNKISQKFLALLLSLLTVLGPMTTAALATEASPGESGNMTERFLDESTSRELAAPAVSKSDWVKDAPEIDGCRYAVYPGFPGIVLSGRPEIWRLPAHFRSIDVR